MERRIAGRMAAGAVALGALLTFGSTAHASTPPAAESPSAVTGGSPRAYLAIDQDFPDPSILQAGEGFVAYSTNSGGRNVPVATASELYGQWTVRTADALPTLGSWARTGLTWAPDVARRPDGRYLMYYTARDIASDRQCVGAAVADDPLGPFAPVGTQPLVCQADQGGTIDPSHFTDTDGRHYLAYKNDGNAIGLPTWLYVQETAADGVTLIGQPVRTIRNDPAVEGGLVEAPYLVRHNGTYLMFYSYGAWDNDSYTEAYATAPSLAGPWTKAAEPLMSTQSLAGKVIGPGGASILHGPTGDHIVYHGVVRSPSFHRAMYVSDLGWTGNTPRVLSSQRP